MNFTSCIALYFFFVAVVLGQSEAWSQSLPGPADTGRIEPLRERAAPLPPSEPPIIPEAPIDTEAPEASRNVSLYLNAIRLEGGTIFSEEELADIYAPYLEHDVTLDVAWEIAAKVTARYRNAGYFLSRAYIPEQEVQDGVVTIHVVEGNIGQVVLDDPVKEQPVIRKMIEQLLAVQPMKTDALESFMLQMNDLPGMNFRAIVQPMPDKEHNMAQLTLLPHSENYRASVRFSNEGSRFLGPYQTSAVYQDSLLPLQQTTVSMLTSQPAEELRYGALRHLIPLYPQWSMELSGSYVDSHPGAMLEKESINGQSTELGIGIHWQPIRRWRENLDISLSLDGKNTNDDIFDNNPLTRDRIRAARLQGDYNAIDAWEGYHALTMNLSRGLPWFGASEAGDLNLSRIEAVPDFTVLAIDYSYQHTLAEDWLGIGRVGGQYASDPLFSSEEFGIGGQSFSRAYDPSQITGDHGLGGSLELRYMGLESGHDIHLVPYGFYEIGKVWNKDTGVDDASAASAGMGLRLTHFSGLSANLGMAWPLTLPVETPIYGGAHSPRLLVQIGYDF